jgi:hypothetical protein
VKVDQGGTVIRSRSGYCNVKPQDLLAGNPIEKDLENRASAAGPGNVTASMQLPFFYTSPDTARVAVAMEIPSEAVKFEKSKGKFHGTINVLGIAYKPDGAVGARFSDTVKLDFENKKEVQAFQEHSMHYESQFDVASGKYNLKVVFNSGGDSFGKLEMPLVIEPYDSKHFSLSGIALSTELHKLSDMNLSLDAALLEDRTPLVSQGMQIVPSGSTRFRKTDTVVLYAEAYEPLLINADPAKPPVVAVQVRVLDRKTGAEKADSGLARVDNMIQKGNPVIPLGLRLPIESVAPGTYQVELKAMDSAGSSSTRLADFEVQ